MFGYLLPDKQELKVKDFALYRAAYCGVCRAIKLEYGQLPRLAVSYDAAVLAVLLIGASGGEPTVKKRICVLNPVKRRPVFEGHEAFPYVAAVSVMLSWGKLADAWADERRVLALPAMAGLARANAKARRRLPEVAAMMGQCLAGLSALEKARCPEIDRPADAMGSMMGGIFAAGPALSPEARALLKPLGYHIGRWIYLADALDDRAKDAKSGAYNAVNAMGGAEGSVELAQKTCLYAASQAAALFDLTEFRWGRDVIENVVYLGMPRVFERVTSKEKAINDGPVEGARGEAGLNR